MYLSTPADDDVSEISARFRKERSTLPLMFIATHLDRLSQHWTRHQPSPAILSHLVKLAAKSATLVHQAVLADPTIDLKVS